VVPTAPVGSFNRVECPHGEHTVHALQMRPRLYAARVSAQRYSALYLHPELIDEAIRLETLSSPARSNR
jgi:hypothetical protein